MKSFFAYTRVSTTRQGEGVSLQQQREAIERFASRAGLSIHEWLEEQETAAKLGRPVFSRMLKRLRKGEAAGVIMHKIDRSARNLKDWADLGQLIDDGIEVHFANEALDLNSRGGRLSADIQAVVAADYIRNLREETKKGFYGRLKQGLSPFPAPLGYLDCGAGKPKAIDPVTGPMIRQAFDLYATGRYGLYALTEESLPPRSSHASRQEGQPQRCKSHSVESVLYWIASRPESQSDLGRHSRTIDLQSRIRPRSTMSRRQKRARSGPAQFLVSTAHSV